MSMGKWSSTPATGGTGPSWLCVSRSRLLKDDSDKNPSRSSFLLQHPWPFESPSHSLGLSTVHFLCPFHGADLDTPPLLQIKVVSFGFFLSHMPLTDIFLLVYVFSFCLCGLSVFHSSRSDVVGPFYLLPPQCTASPAYYYYILFIYLGMSVGGWVSATTPRHMCEDRRTDLGNWFSPSEHDSGWQGCQR